MAPLRVRPLLLAIPVALIVLATALPALAATIIARSVPELNTLSEAIVLAKVEAATVGLDAQDQVQTRYRLAVQQWWKGEGPATVELARFGGVWEGHHYAIDGDVDVEVGDTIVVFLRRGPDAWYSTLLGWSVFEVDGHGDDAVITRNQQDFGLFAYDKMRRLRPASSQAAVAPATLGALRAQAAQSAPILGKEQ